MILPRNTLPLTGRPLADVAVHGVQRRTGERHKKPYIARWRVNGRDFSRSYRTKAEAERVRSALLVAAQTGEAFDETTGEPVTWQPMPEETRTHE